MRIVLINDEALRLEPEPGPMTIEAPSADQSYSPFHMLASGLALCTFSVLYSWAETVGLPADDLALEARWSFAESPHRIAGIDLLLDWPSLPANRTATAYRVAELCPIHHTITHGAQVTVARAEAAAVAQGDGAHHAHRHAHEHGHDHAH